MSNTKQLPPFQFKITDTLSLEVNAKVDMDGMLIHMKDVLRTLMDYKVVMVFLMTTSEGVSFPVDGIMSSRVQEDMSMLLKDYPVKVHYNSNFVTMFVDFNQTKTVDIQTVFYQGFNVKELILENQTWVNAICKQAIEESKKETLND